jgi:predicted enzyme related to lactoylglutathione lyase
MVDLGGLRCLRGSLATGLRSIQPPLWPYAGSVITAVHTILYSHDAAADRAFLRDILGLPNVDAGDGWLIFKSPPGEIAVHPTDGPSSHGLYLMCDDLDAQLADWQANGLEVTSPPTERGWGRLAEIRLPGGSLLGVYQPAHPTAYDL